jgi:hypothetical protein
MLVSTKQALFLTFCGICARADAITLALSSVKLLTIDPRENTTTPFSPELWTKSSISCEERNQYLIKEQQHSKHF